MKLWNKELSALSTPVDISDYPYKLTTNSGAINVLWKLEIILLNNY